MKKVTILSHPTQIATIQLDDLDYDDQGQASDRVVRKQIQMWRKLRQGVV